MTFRRSRNCYSCYYYCSSIDRCYHFPIACLVHDPDHGLYHGRGLYHNCCDDHDSIVNACCRCRRCRECRGFPYREIYANRDDPYETNVTKKRSRLDCSAADVVAFYPSVDYYVGRRHQTIHPRDLVTQTMTSETNCNVCWREGRRNSVDVGSGC